MIYQSTRNNDIRASSAQAILDGMAAYLRKTAAAAVFFFASCSEI